MQYKLIKTDLWLKDKLIPEGSTLELSQADAKPLAEYLKELASNKAKDNSASASVHKTTNTKKKVSERIYK